MCYTAPVNIKEAKEKGQPVYIPGGAIKGWDYAGDFFPNPDFVAPEPPKVEQIKNICPSCKSEMSDKGKALMKGLSVFYLCNNCIKKYGGGQTKI